MKLESAEEAVNRVRAREQRGDSFIVVAVGAGDEFETIDEEGLALFLEDLA